MLPQSPQLPRAEAGAEESHLDPVHQEETTAGGQAETTEPRQWT